jgi:SAM-dependent methyltransferase
MNNKFWDEKYSGVEYFYGEEPNEFLTQQLKHISKIAKILCLCEGEGRNAVYLAKNGFDVTAVDFSEEAKTKALRLAVRQNVKLDYHLSDLKNYDFGDKKWDAIISVFAHLSLSLRQTIYPKVISSLREDGIFIIEAYTPKQIEYGTGGPKDIEMMCSDEILRNDLIGMNWMFIEEGEKYLNEGLGHSGRSYTIRGVAKKS